MKLARGATSTTKIIDMFTTSDDLKTIRAEALFTSFLEEHNMPLAVTGHAGPLFRKIFPDSNIVLY